MFTNVVVGVDEREGGRDAIALAKTLLAADGELTLAHVFVQNKVGSRVGGIPGWMRDASARAQLLSGPPARRRPAEHPMARGDVGRSGLHDIAEAIGADLLVVGSSRRGLLGRIRVADDTRAALTNHLRDRGRAARRQHRAAGPDREIGGG